MDKTDTSLLLGVQPMTADPVELTHLIVKGAREHNLKGVDLAIPKRALVVFSGVSGSGKSSLAFDTFFAEGQRRYIESLSAYARQFLGQQDKPRYDSIRGLSPTIAIEQKSAGRNPRSTVATITEISDHLRVLYARIGKQYCHVCGASVGRGDPASMVERILILPDILEGAEMWILAPIIEHRKGEYRDLLQELQAEGYARVRIDGALHETESAPALVKTRKHSIDVVVGRLCFRQHERFRAELTDTVEAALRRGQGRLIVALHGRPDLLMSEERTCCGIAFPELSPPLFSSNAPQGMCSECHGLGEVLSMDPDRIVPDRSLSIRMGAVVPWKSYFANDTADDSWGREIFNAIEREWGVDWDRPWNQLSARIQQRLLYGHDKELTVRWSGKRGKGEMKMAYEGLVNTLMRRYMATKSEDMKTYYEKFMSTQTCCKCDGRRLRQEVLAVRIGGKSIADVMALTPVTAHAFFQKLALTGNDALIASEIVKEIQNRLGFLIGVGLDYLTLDRRGPTLSGGEAQRIRLASQVGSELTGVLYVLDEPSIGLHPRDNGKLLAMLCRLRDLGNTVLVVEHDRETLMAADHLVDFGPGAGLHGGEVVAQGTPAEVMAEPASLTGQYLAGKRHVSVLHDPRTVGGRRQKYIEVRGASENNLRISRVRFPLGVLTCVTGVSGAGKSTLINQILRPALLRRLHGANESIGAHDTILGVEYLDKVIAIDQEPIGRTPRSNPATYTKVLDPIRDLFSLLPEARVRGFTKSRFSFNIKGGRCEACQGDGHIRVEMHFLADVFVPCEQCRGRRFNEQTLTVRYKGFSIADVLDLTVDEACVTFASHTGIITILKTLQDVGLGYIKLGQSATTLSGGEAQRMKLSRELAKRSTGRTLYILDEPTTGLHFEDVRHLLVVLNRLVNAGNSVIVIEHNTDVIASADWIIDLGPEGGDGGGRVVVEGTPAVVAACRKSYTGKSLTGTARYPPRPQSGCRLRPSAG